MSLTTTKKPNLEFLKKAAKKLLKRVRRKDKDAIEEVLDEHPYYEDIDDLDSFKLADAQYLIALRMGETSWRNVKNGFEENTNFLDDALITLPPMESEREQAIETPNQNQVVNFATERSVPNLDIQEVPATWIQIAA